MRAPVKVSLAGDYCALPAVEKLLLSGRRDPAWFLREVSGIFRSSDLAIVNLECPLTESSNPIRKVGPCLKSHAETIRLLTSAGVRLVTTATNHIRDFGNEGVLDTLKHCEAHGVRAIGSGASLEEARHVSYHQIHGQVLAVVNAAESEFAIATATRAGANPLDLVYLLSDVREARSRADHVLLIVHGGLEYTHYPSPRSVAILRFLAEQDVSAVVRHHPHYVQGYEVWKGVPIFYSLGNLFFPWIARSLPGSYEGIVLTLELAVDGGCTFAVRGVEQRIDAMQVVMMEPAAEEAFLGRLMDYSKILTDPSALQRDWSALLQDRMDSYLGPMTLPNYLLERIFRKLGRSARIRPNLRKRLLYRNFLQCDAHREAIVDILRSLDDTS